VVETLLNPSHGLPFASLVPFRKPHPRFTLDEVAMGTLSRFTISIRCCTIKFVPPSHTHSRLRSRSSDGAKARHATVRQLPDEGGFTSPKLRERFAFTLPTSDPPKDGFASPSCSALRAGSAANRRPEFRGIMMKQREYARAFTVKQRERPGAFTLLEILLVTGIIAIMMVLLVPAFTSIKTGSDVTSATYTIKGVLDQACTYAKTNNTYTWVGFFEENVASTTPGTGGVGRLVMSIVASKDGTNVATTGQMASTSLIQVGKLTKIDNVHLAATADGTNLPQGSNQPPGTTFDARPTVASTYCLGDTTSSTPFLYPLSGTTQYTFTKAVQFSSDGEARVSNNTYSPQPVTVAEIGLRQTHATTVDMTSPNLVAIQVGGAGGDVTIYRR
jgi:type II secretory pathway pseudopilin PulG